MANPNHHHWWLIEPSNGRRLAYLGNLDSLEQSYSSGNRNSILIALSYATTECRICTAILRLLRDKSNDVQAIPLNMLGVLLTKVKEEQVLEIADSSAN